MNRRYVFVSFFVLVLLAAGACGAATAATAAADPHACWQPMPDPSNFGCTRIAFADEEHGWAAGSEEGGPVAVTDDSGLSWTRVAATGFRTVTDLAAVDADSAWVVGTRYPWDGFGAFVLHTHDRGVSWERYDFPLGGLDPREICFTDAKHGWVVIGTGMYVTTDGGHTWALSAGPDDVVTMDFLDSDRGWVLADSSTYNQGTELWGSADGGATWQQVAIPSSTQGYASVCFVDDQHGFLAGSSLLATSDGGHTWSARAPLNSEATVRAATDGLHVWAALRSGWMLASEDGGQTWVRQAEYGTSIYGVLPDVEIRGDRGWVAGPRFSRTDTNGLGDLHPPVTTCSPPALMNAPVIVHLSATDVGSGVAGIWHSVNGGPWEEGENVTVGTDALERSVVRVAAVDHYGNWEQDNSFTIGYDFEGPTPWFEPQTSDGLDVWINHDSWVRVGVTDDLKGAGVKDFEVSLDGGGWKRYGTGYHMVVTRAEKDHGNDGAHRIACRGTDRLENLGPVVERSLAIDTRRPRAAAGYVAHARSRGTGTLRLKISDASPCSRACRVVVTITTTSGKKLGVLRPDGWLKTGSYVTLKFSCPLKAGRYKFVVRATDGAGNLTVKPAWNYLVVSTARGVTGKASPGVLDLEPLGASPAPVTLRHASVGL